MCKNEKKMVRKFQVKHSVQLSKWDDDDNWFEDSSSCPCGSGDEGCNCVQID